MAKNVLRKPGFEQVCVWRGVTLPPALIKEWEAAMLETFGARVQYLEEITTRPDIDPFGNPVPGTGGRSDLFFAVHSRDLRRFAYPRMEYGIKWIEDVLAKANYLHQIYPRRVYGYRSWDANKTSLSQVFNGNLILRPSMPNEAALTRDALE
jgi:hypothetical protein